MSRSRSTTGVRLALITFSSLTVDLAASGLSQNPPSPIFASSSLRRFCLLGKSKRVPDRDDPGRKVFDRLREVLVDHGRGSVAPWRSLVHDGYGRIDD